MDKLSHLCSAYTIKHNSSREEGEKGVGERMLKAFDSEHSSMWNEVYGHRITKS